MVIAINILSKVFAAIDIAIDNLDNYVKKKKYTKKVNIYRRIK